jgi:hypothetical protein
VCSVSDLRKLGRDAGFAKFYSPQGLSEVTDSFVASSIRRFFFNFVRHSSLLRSLALLQFGNAIFMWKRSQASLARSSPSMNIDVGEMWGAKQLPGDSSACGYVDSVLCGNADP